jgi:hypothetical protein
MREARRRSVADAVPAIVGCLATATAGIAMWRSPAPWTFTLDTGSVFLGQTLPAFRAWFSGRIPEWSDLLWGGFPLVGDCTSAVLYPLYAIVYGLTLDVPLRFFDVALALHLGIFAAGSATLVRRLGASPAAAALAGVLAACDPFAHYCAIAHFPVFGAQAWWPWAFVAVEALGRPSTPAVGGAMALGWIAIALQVLVGVPEQATYCAVPAALWLLLRRAGLGFGQRLLRTALLGLGAAALAAPQLLPTALVLSWTHRAGTPPHYQFGSLWLTKPEQLLVVGTGVLNGLPSFLGIATLALAAIAVVTRRPGAFFLLATAGIGFALALGPQVGLYELVHRVPPLTTFRNPGKIYALAEYGALWLAALGADSLWRRRSNAARVAAALLVAAMLAERAAYLPQEIAALAALRKGDGLTAARYERLAALERLQRRDETAPPPVVYDAGGPMGGEYARSIGALFGISSIHAGSVALLSPAHFELLDRTPAPLLDLFGVDYLLAPAAKCAFMARHVPWPPVETGPDDCVLANPDRRGRYEILRDVVPVASQREMLDVLPKQPKPVPIVGPDDVPRSPGPGQLVVTKYAPGHATLRAVLSSPSLVLVRDSFAPGWTARVDGRVVAPYPAAGIFFAVPVGAGTHEIALDYRTPGLRAGALVAGGWIVFAAALAWRRRHAVAG